MVNNKLIQTLKNIGLGETEALVYLTSIELGPSTVQKIARRSELKRTTIYGIINSLKDKGLMRTDSKGFKNIYVAENPENLESMLETRRNEFQQKLPELMALYKLEGNQGGIKYYTGIKAMKNIYLGTLEHIKNGDEYLVITNQKKWFELDPDFWMKQYIEERAKLPCKTRLISQDSDVAREHKKYQKNYNEEFKIIESNYNIDTDMVLTPKQLIIVDLLPPITTLVIENRNIINLQKQTFDLLWENIKT